MMYLYIIYHYQLTNIQTNVIYGYDKLEKYN